MKDVKKNQTKNPDLTSRDKKNTMTEMKNTLNKIKGRLGIADK